MSWWSLRFLRPAAGPGSREDRLASRTVSRAGVDGAAQRRLALPWAISAGVCLLVLHVLLFPPVADIADDFPREGEIAPRLIRAPFAFQAPLLERDVEMRRLERTLVEPPVLRRVSGRQAEQTLPRFLALRQAVLAQREQPAGTAEERAARLAERFPDLPADKLRAALQSGPPEVWLAAIQAVLMEVLDEGVVDQLPSGTYTRVRIVSPGAEAYVEASRVTPEDRLRERLTLALRGQDLPRHMESWAVELMRPLILPNLVYDAAETRLRQEAARRAVPSEREFMRGERIVDQGVRVSEQEALILRRLQELLRERGGPVGGFERAQRLVMRELLVACALVLFGWIGLLSFPAVMSRPRHLMAVAALVALFMAAAAFSLGRSGLGVFAVPVPLLALLGTVLFRAPVGHATNLLGVALLAVLPSLPASAVFAWLVLGTVTVVAVRRIHRRSQFYQTIALLCLLTAFLITVFRLAGGESTLPAGREYAAGLLTPVVAVAFALFLLPIIEPLVGVVSDLTLLELSDLNHPLLKRMALESQGTYHHSQVVSQLAEQAARAIGANALLTRVGALFHDIGKLNKAEYFVENQGGGPNKHDELSPSMSALVVASHVKDGVEMGRQWRLPQAVIDFIPEHHGTSVMEFFYHKALENEDNATVKVDDFRYPGPKPQSRETAILMLADAVEAVARSLAKPTPSRIREATKQVIDKRMLSGELDESQLTLSDLARVREAFISLLSGIHHMRLAYPGQKEREVARARVGEPPRPSERDAVRPASERRPDG